MAAGAGWAGQCPRSGAAQLIDQPQHARYRRSRAAASQQLRLVLDDPGQLAGVWPAWRIPGGLRR